MEIGSNLVLDELTRCKELVSKLQADIESTTFSADACRAVIGEILSSLENTVSMLTESSSRSLTESPARSKGLGVVRKDREICKKRTTQPKWTRKVRLGTGPGVEGPVDDGYKWRKYGHKDILAAKHPRAYFRCTHSKSQGCPAKKQVQRSEDNPLAIDVTYRGAHTCRCEPSAPQAVDAAAPQHGNQDLLLGFQTAGLKVKTEGLDSKSPEPPASSSLSFSFPSTPAEVPTFSPSSTLDHYCSIGGGYSTAFVSPATSESNYFSMSPRYGGQNLPAAAESDFAEVVVPSAATNSSSVLDDMGSFLFDCVNLDQDFLLDTW